MAHLSGYGGFAVVCLDLTDPRVADWELRTLTLEGGEVVKAMCHGLGYLEVGIEPLDIGLLELLAALWTAERAPPLSSTCLLMPPTSLTHWKR
jgi:hypothetical protein